MSGSDASRVDDHLDQILAAMSRIRRYTNGIDQADLPELQRQIEILKAR